MATMKFPTPGEGLKAEIRDVQKTTVDKPLMQELDEICHRVVQTLMSKREDYGTANIAITGRAGLSVRVMDKAARLLNLSKDGMTPNHEGLRDTYEDLIGYALIGLLGEAWGLEPLPTEGTKT
jgi:hypothetical protein